MNEKTYKRMILLVCAIVVTLAATGLSAASLYAPDGTYLGNVGTNQYDPNSINNPYGRYGNQYSPDSVHNQYGKYGNPYSPQYSNPYGQSNRIQPIQPIAPRGWR